MGKFKIIEHTADIGIEVYGRNLNELFENAACGMFSIITDISKIEEKKEVNIEISQPTLEDLLHSWLAELLFRHSTDEMLFREFEVQVDEKKFRLSGKASGEKINRGEHHLKAEIKAVTYYQLKVQRYAISNKRYAYKARIIFDV